MIVKIQFSRETRCKQPKKRKAEKKKDATFIFSVTDNKDIISKKEKVQITASRYTMA